MKWIWIIKAFQVVGIVSGKIPQILADGNVTVDEMVDLTTTILAVFDIPVSFEVPEELKGQIIGAALTD